MIRKGGINFKKRKLRISGYIKFFAIAAVGIVCFSAFAMKGASYAFAVLLAALIHEAGHMAAAYVLGVKMVKKRRERFPLSIKYDFSTCSYFKEATVGFAGALSNLITCAVCLIFGCGESLYGTFFIFSNATLALFNLMPISPLDGFGIISATASEVLSPDTVVVISSVVSGLFSFAFFVLTVYIQFKIGANLSLMLLSAFLLLNCFKEKSQGK